MTYNYTTKKAHIGKRDNFFIGTPYYRACVVVYNSLYRLCSLDESIENRDRQRHYSDSDTRSVTEKIVYELA